MEENQNWNIQVDNKAYHTSNIAFATKVSLKSISVVDVSPSCLYAHPASCETNDKRNESEYDPEENSTLLEGIRHANNSSACHRIPSTEYRGNTSVLAFIVLIFKKSTEIDYEPTIRNHMIWYTEELRVVQVDIFFNLVCFNGLVVLHSIVASFTYFWGHHFTTVWSKIISLTHKIALTMLDCTVVAMGLP